MIFCFVPFRYFDYSVIKNFELSERISSIPIMSNRGSNLFAKNYEMLSRLNPDQQPRM